jgi:hypothetical protein
MSAPGHYMQWRSLFAVVDDGSISMNRYDEIEAAMVKQAREFQSIGCLVILPPNTKPPPEPTRKRVRDILNKLQPSLNALAYLVEGSGFGAAAARATLIGLKVFSRNPYPVYVERSMTATLARMLEHGGDGDALTIATVERLIAESRRAAELARATSRAS